MELGDQIICVHFPMFDLSLAQFRRHRPQFKEPDLRMHQTVLEQIFPHVALTFDSTYKHASSFVFPSAPFLWASCSSSPMGSSCSPSCPLLPLPTQSRERQQTSHGATAMP